jgi:5'-phosphate synthase pdxT subunit
VVKAHPKTTAVVRGAAPAAHYAGGVSPPSIGVFALQGDVREHLVALSSLGVDAFAVRRLDELDRCDALVMPGGESTTMVKLSRAFDVFDAFSDRIKTGMPVLGTCAGMIMLADRVLDGIPGQETFGGLDITVRRNAFGRQVDSFEGDIDFTIFDDPVHAVFIRAPWVEDAGPGVEVLASVAVPGVGDRIVAVQQGPVIATSFHPEVSNDLRIHRYFLGLVTAAAS